VYSSASVWATAAGKYGPSGLSAAGCAPGAKPEATQVQIANANAFIAAPSGPPLLLCTGAPCPAVLIVRSTSGAGQLV
jgi:hypothetical protein